MILNIHCYTYNDPEGNNYRQYDDNEPSGTAGKLDETKVEKTSIILFIVVIRYFGGTLLGTGGFDKCRNAASEALNNANIIKCYMPLCIR